MAHGYGRWFSGWSALAGSKMTGKKNAGGSISIRHFCLAGLRNLRGTRLGAN